VLFRFPDYARSRCDNGELRAIFLPPLCPFVSFVVNRFSCRGDVGVPGGTPQGVTSILKGLIVVTPGLTPYALPKKHETPAPIIQGLAASAIFNFQRACRLHLAASYSQILTED
jgi:hypothetical protein